jgi:ADP-ribosylglycohydrolase
MADRNPDAGLSDLVDRAEGCLIGGLIGDAMGTPSEGLEPDEIERRFGWIDRFSGDGTDDSIMKYLLADALIATDGCANADDWAAEWLRRPASIGGDKLDRFFASVLHSAAKLRYGLTPRRVALGNMPSSSSAMSIAPVGIVNAGHPRAAAAQAQEIASLLHVDEVAFCQDGAVAIAAAIAVALSPGARLDDVLAAATAHIKPWSGREMIALIREALALARKSADYAAFRTTYHQCFRRPIACDSRETVPATLALLQLAAGDPYRTLCFAANFGRDADTIGCMAGSLAGALAGRRGFPADWLAVVAQDADRDQGVLARTLVDVARRKAAREIAAWRPLAGGEA